MTEKKEFSPPEKTAVSQALPQLQFDETSVQQQAKRCPALPYRNHNSYFTTAMIDISLKKIIRLGNGGNMADFHRVAMPM